jgi:thiol-disulfide isomerase/thioredoxin
MEEASFLNNFDHSHMIMRTYILSILVLLNFIAKAQGYKIVANYNYQPYSYLYLGYYFGEKKFLLDSALIDKKGKASFVGNNKLTGGLYIIVDPAKSRFFDVVIDQEQFFEVDIDTAFVLKGIRGSEENNQLETYKQATTKIFNDYPQWQSQLKEAKNPKDSAAAQEKISAAAKRAEQWRDSFVTKHPDSYVTLLFRLMGEPPYNLSKAATKEDTLALYQAYKTNFWKDIPIGDSRLLRTPMFEARLTKYMEQIVTRDPDSMKVEIDKFILYARADTTMFKYYVSRFTNEYMNPKFMGLDVIFLHLFEKYYQTNQVTWLNEKDKELIYNRAYNLMGNIVGKQAAELNLLDTLARPKNLYDVKAPYTLLVFWDPDCGHCREQVPQIDSLFNADWNKTGMKLIGVLVDTIRKDNSSWPAVRKKWVQFIADKKLKGWEHWYETLDMRNENIRKNIPNFRQNYDVYQTPTIYLLDDQKRIVAKKVSPEQIHDFLEFQKKKNK